METIKASSYSGPVSGSSIYDSLYSEVEMIEPMRAATETETGVSSGEVLEPKEEMKEELKEEVSEVPTGATMGTDVVQSSEVPLPAIDQTKNTLVIKNLPFKYSKQELDSLLTEYKTNPKNVRMMKDDQNRFTGIAFIRCPSQEEAARLILAMHNLDIGGRNIQVEFKKRRKKKGTESSSDTEAVMPTPLAKPVEATPPSDPKSAFKRRPSLPSAQMPSWAQQYQERPSVTAPARPSFLDRRRSIAVTDEYQYRYPYRFNFSDSTAWNSHQPVPGIQPIRQPNGPDNKSAGFYTAYRLSRTT